MNNSFKLLLGLAALLVGISIVSGYVFWQGQSSAWWSEHSARVLYRESDLLSAFQDMSLSSRGYLLNGDSELLALYQSAEKQQAHMRAELARLTSNNPVEQTNLKTLDKSAQEFSSLSRGLVETKDTSLIESQKVAMNKIRQSLGAIVNEESSLLKARSSRTQTYYTLGWTALAFQLLAGLGLLISLRGNMQQLVVLNANLQTEIEQRERTEKALKETAIRLTNSNSDLQQFAYVASHDLQEPLRAVAGFLTLIASKQKDQLDPETEGWINHAVEGSQRMRALINDLLAYARVESRGKELEKVDSNKALEQAKNDLSVVLEETGAQVNSTKLPVVLGEEGQLAQLFQNLIGNAVKFRGAAKPVIDINSEQLNGDWVFAVKDNGIGFDQEHAERIFVIFQRLQGRDEYKGTGIGLALCKKIVERHRGRIWAQSGKGKGSTFFFTIPAIQGDNKDD